MKSHILVFITVLPILSGCALRNHDTDKDQACLESPVLLTNLEFQGESRHFALPDGSYCKIFDRRGYYA